MKERILKFIDYLNISVREFEMRCGMSNGYINSMRKGLGATKIENVLNAFPQLNRKWLLTGEGTMLMFDATASSIEEAEAKMRGTSPPQPPDNVIITALLEQLKEKDVQIREKNVQIDRLLRIIENKG